MHPIHSIIEILNSLRCFRREEFKREERLSRPLCLFKLVGDVHLAAGVLMWSLAVVQSEDAFLKLDGLLVFDGYFFGYTCNPDQSSLRKGLSALRVDSDVFFLIKMRLSRCSDVVLRNLRPDG